MKRTILFSLFLMFFACLSISFSVSYADTPVCGKTYPIAEPDLLEEMHQRAQKLLNDKKKLAEIRQRLKKQLEHYRPAYLSQAYLPPSDKSFTYLHDVVYTLPFDIPKVVNGKVVGILYPKGFTFHVLRYIPYGAMPTLVIFDIKNRLQREWVAKHYAKKAKVMLISVSGDLNDLADFIKKIKRPVYFNLPKINERFGLQYTISIVKRSDKYIDDVEVRVVGMKEIEKELKKVATKTRH